MSFIRKLETQLIWGGIGVSVVLVEGCGLSIARCVGRGVWSLHLLLC